MMFKTNRRHNKFDSPAKQKVIIQDLSKELIPITGANRFALVIQNLLTAEECANLIRRSEDEGYDDALIQGPGGKQILRQDIRSCGRCIIDDIRLADAIYVRILNALRGTELEEKIMHAPWITASKRSSSSTSPSGGGNDNNDAEEETISAVGLNERMRFLRYEPGHFFAPHQDLRFVRGPDSGDRAGETSHITVQLYLNDKFKGGTTRFLCGKRYYDVKPKTGSVLIFDHNLLHEGSRVTGGMKYSVRTDIMFTPRRSDASRTVTPDGHGIEKGSKNIGSAPTA
ncbi:hypothetical protein ACHAXR_003106 [Thalassiosira sp. AJA248-18]